MAFSVEYIYRVLDRYSVPLGNISRATQRFQNIAASASKKIDRLSYRLETSGKTMSNFRNAIGGVAITGGMFKFASSASEMSDAMADVERVTSMSGPALAAFQEQLQAMGRATGRSAEGLAAIAYEGGKIGVTDDQLGAFVQTVMKTATAFDMADSEAGRAIGSIRAKLGLSVESVDELMQRVNYLADNTSASGNQMINIIERTSGTFAALNIPPAVTAGWAAFANQVEVTPELAASGLNQMMMKMMQMPGMLEKMLRDPKASVKGFLEKLSNMPEIKRNALVIKMFGLEASRFVMKAVSNTKLIDDAMEKAASSEALGSMDREFANILERSSTAAKRIKQTLIDVSRAIGRVFLKVFDQYSERIRQATQWVLDFVKAHPGLIKIVGAIGLVLAGLSAVLVPLGILFSMVGAALPVLSGFAAAIGAVSLPIVLTYVAIAALVAAFTALAAFTIKAYQQSAMFRQSLLNLADAFSPIINGLGQLFTWFGQLIGVFGDADTAAMAWGDHLSYWINFLAAFIKSFIDTWIIFGKTIAWAFGLIDSGIDVAIGLFTDFDSTITGLGEKVESFFEKINFVEKGIGGAWAGFKEIIGVESVQNAVEQAQQINAPAEKIIDQTKVAMPPIEKPNFENIGAQAAKEKAGARAQDTKVEMSGRIDVTASGGAKINRADIGLNTGYNNLAVAQ